MQGTSMRDPIASQLVASIVSDDLIHPRRLEYNVTSVRYVPHRAEKQHGSCPQLLSSMCWIMAQLLLAKLVDRPATSQLLQLPIIRSQFHLHPPPIHPLLKPDRRRLTGYKLSSRFQSYQLTTSTKLVSFFEELYNITQVVTFILRPCLDRSHGLGFI